MEPELVIINMSELAKQTKLNSAVMKSMVDTMAVTIGQLVDSRDKLGIINYGSVVSLYINAMGLMEACGIDKGPIEAAVLPGGQKK